MSVSAKVIVRKRRGNRVVALTREHYLHDDIPCGLQDCELCVSAPTPERRANLLRLCSFPGWGSSPVVFVLDEFAVIRQLDALERCTSAQFLVLETVLAAVKSRAPRKTHLRLRDNLLPISSASANFALFSNEHRSGVYVERSDGESLRDYETRTIVQACRWLQEHWSAAGIQLVLASDSAIMRAVYADVLDKVQVRIVPELLEAFQIEGLVDLYAELPDPLHDVNQEPMGVLEGERSRTHSRISHSPYLSLSQINLGLTDGSLRKGKFRVNPFNYLEGYILVTDGDEVQRVLIQGLECQNRVIDGDSVVFRILPPEQWKLPSSCILELENEDENSTAMDEDAREGAIPTGVVVGVLRRNWRPCCGAVETTSLQEGDATALVLPVDKRIPKIRVRSRRLAALVGKKLVVTIDGWEIGSRYPNGHVVKEIGDGGDKGVETEVLLIENEIPNRKFSEAALASLPSADWSVTDHHRQSRWDLRTRCIVSVDPPNCTDIDDALHCRKLEEDLFEVGIHIADVTAFIAHDSPLDREAVERGSTVYLVDRRIEMLPSLLSSCLCSLQERKERLAFSVILTLRSDATIVHSEFGRSVICSKEAMTYEAAQVRIDKARKSLASGRPVQDDISDSLLMLANLAKRLRERRIQKGALSLASPEVKFKIEEETDSVAEVALYQVRETNKMVEEFMLLANVAVAEKLLVHFPNCAMLRRHPRPSPEMFEPLLKAAAAVGFEVDPSTSKTLNDSLDRIEQASQDKDPYLGTLIRIIATRCMSQAICFSSGEVSASEYLHYGLAAPVYTHFTSPIRRYTDVVVHRLLASTLGYSALPQELQDSRRIQSIAEVINERHRSAQFASRASIALHTVLLFKNQPQEDDGRIIRVLRNGLVILVPKFGIEGVAYVEEGARFDAAAMQLHTPAGAIYRILDPVCVRIQVDGSPGRNDRVTFELLGPGKVARKLA